MALAEDLLAQARHPATKEPKKPRQASLRRAVSSSYYALFHLLTADGARAASTANRAPLRARIARAFAHSDMRVVCHQFAQGQLAPGTSALLSDPLQPELRLVAQTFVMAQEARHDADYDTIRPVSRLDALAVVSVVEDAFAAWKTIRRTPNARIFLAALLLQRHWGR